MVVRARRSVGEDPYGRFGLEPEPPPSLGSGCGQSLQGGSWRSLGITIAGSPNYLCAEVVLQMRKVASEAE